MHITLIHQVFIRPDDPGGTRHYEFARHLVEKGHRVTVLTGSRSYLTGEPIPTKREEEPIEGLRIVRLDVLGGRQDSYAWRTAGFLSFALAALWEAVKRPAPDVVWATTPPLFQAWTAWAVARLKGVRWVLEVRDLWPEFAVEAGALTDPNLIAASRWLEGFLYDHADRIVVNSPGFVEHVRAPEARIRVVPNGVDTAQLKAVTQPRNPEDEFIALYAGAHGVANDLDQLLDTAEALLTDGRISLVLLGEGPEKRRLREEAQRRGLSNITFLPPVKKAEMAAVLGDANAGLAVLKRIPMFTTTYPNKVLDYMAAGLPVVLGIDGAIRELVEGAGAGVYAGSPEEIAKAIRELANDPVEAADMGRSGRLLVEREFDRATLAADLETVFRELTEHTPGPAPTR